MKNVLFLLVLLVLIVLLIIFKFSPNFDTSIDPYGEDDATPDNKVELTPIISSDASLIGAATHLNLHDKNAQGVQTIVWTLNRTIQIKNDLAQFIESRMPVLVRSKNAKKFKLLPFQSEIQRMTPQYLIKHAAKFKYVYAHKHKTFLYKDVEKPMMPFLSSHPDTKFHDTHHGEEAEIWSRELEPREFFEKLYNQGIQAVKNTSSGSFVYYSQQTQYLGDFLNSKIDTDEMQNSLMVSKHGKGTFE